MVDLARVMLWNDTVGAIQWNEDTGYGTFEYDRGFLKSGLDVAPITMPAVNGPRLYTFNNLPRETYNGLPGLLADSLPDRFGNQLINAYLAQQGRSPGSMNPVERLCYTGKRGMGALEYEPVVHPFPTESKTVEIQHLVELANNILNDRDSLKTRLTAGSATGLTDILRVGTSAGGARAKAIIAYNASTGDTRSGQIDNLTGYDYWIIKFDGVRNSLLSDPLGYCSIEYAYYLMAIACGIEMSPCRQLRENGRVHFMTRRFDRLNGDKLHMQTLCAIAHYDYNQPDVYSYEQAFQVMRGLRLPYTDAEQMYRRMVFNVIARNQDDHTKNISFIMDRGGKWKLAPAYDITYAYDPTNKWMKAHQMSVNGKFDSIKETDLLTVAANMNIKKPKRIIAEITKGIMQWRTFAEEAGVTAKQAAQIESTFLTGT